LDVFGFDLEFFFVLGLVLEHIVFDNITGWNSGFYVYFYGEEGEGITGKRIRKGEE